MPTPHLPCSHPVGRRHLAYFLLPVGNWQRGVDQLRCRWSLFTGRKVVAVATGGPVREQQTGRPLVLDTPAAVRAYLPPDAELIDVPNDPARGELAGWGPLWDRVLSDADAADAVLYCHAKGVTRPTFSTAHRWAELLYTLCLDHWPLTEKLLSQHPIAGPLKRPGHFFAAARPHVPDMARSAWHFSGNFWWVRAGAVREALSAVPVPVDPWGCEAWPGIVWGPDEAGTVFSPAAPLDLYTPAGMDRCEAEYRAWLAARRPILYVVTPTARPHNLPRVAASLTPLRERFELRWVVVFSDGKHPGRHGADERNEAIDMIPADAAGFVWFLDDDNAVHPDFPDVLADAIDRHPDAAGFVFGQQRADGRTLPAAVNPPPCAIDTAQYVFRRAAIGPVRWGYDMLHDHGFYAAVRDRAGGIVAVDRVVTYHNGLTSPGADRV